MVQLSSSLVLVAAFAAVAPSFAAPVVQEDNGYYARQTYDEVDVRELEEILARTPQPWLRTAGKVLSKVGTIGTVASIGTSIAGMFKSKDKKRSLDFDDELEFREFVEELSEREIQELEERWLRLAGKVLSKVGTIGTVASIGSSIGGMFKSKKRSFDFEDDLEYREFDDELSERELQELEERWLRVAGKVLNGLGTAGTIASIGSSIKGHFSKKKRSLYESDEEELFMRMLADLNEEVASLERRHEYPSLNELD